MTLTADGRVRTSFAPSGRERARPVEETVTLRTSTRVLATNSSTGRCSPSRGVMARRATARTAWDNASPADESHARLGRPVSLHCADWPELPRSRRYTRVRNEPRELVSGVPACCRSTTRPGSPVMSCGAFSNRGRSPRPLEVVRSGSWNAPPNRNRAGSV